MVKTKDKKTEDILSSWHEKQELWEDKKTEIGQKTKCLSVFGRQKDINMSKFMSFCLRRHKSRVEDIFTQ